MKRANKIWFLYNCSTTSCASNWYCPPISRQILPLFMTSAVKPIWRVRRKRNVISSLWHLWRVFRLRLCLSFLLDTPSQSTTAREGIEGNPHIKQMRHRHIFICILSCNRLVLNRFKISKLPTSVSLKTEVLIEGVSLIICEFLKKYFCKSYIDGSPSVLRTANQMHDC